MKPFVLFLICLFSLRVFSQNEFDVSRENIKYANSNVIPGGYLQKLWSNDDIYYEKDAQGGTGKWSGNVFRYSAKKCYKVSQSDKDVDFKNAINWIEISCDNDFKKRAQADELPTISNIRVYLEKVWSCLNKNDKDCLRPYISRAVQVRVDAIDFTDQRNEFMRIWSIKELKEIFLKPSDKIVEVNNVARKNNGKWMVTSLIPPP